MRRILVLGVCAFGAVALYQAVPLLLSPASTSSRVQAEPMSMSVPRLPALTHLQIVDPTPVRLVIPAINVDANIEARGLDSQRNMQTPRDFHDVAWYKLGPPPGRPGNALINGHVNWWTGDAVFTRLGKLRVGDSVTVLQADGQAVHFRVTGKRTVDGQARIASLFAPSPIATLTLITCSGVWNPLTQSDTQRLIVSATLE